MESAPRRLRVSRLRTIATVLIAVIAAATRALPLGCSYNALSYPRKRASSFGALRSLPDTTPSAAPSTCSSSSRRGRRLPCPLATAGSKVVRANVSSGDRIAFPRLSTPSRRGFLRTAAGPKLLSSRARRFGHHQISCGPPARGGCRRRAAIGGTAIPSVVSLPVAVRSYRPVTIVGALPVGAGVYPQGATIAAEATRANREAAAARAGRVTMSPKRKYDAANGGPPPRGRQSKAAAVSESTPLAAPAAETGAVAEEASASEGRWKPPHIDVDDGDDIEDLVLPQQTLLPSTFDDAWNAIVDMRSRRDAPVDTQGCECLGDAKASPAVWRFQTLVAIFLSSQTRDEQTAATMRRLREWRLDVGHVLETDHDTLSGLLRGVSFHITKAKNLRSLCQVLRERYGADIPRPKEELLELPGIGPKMANLVLSVAWNSSEGIAVDVHVHRIANRLGWVRTKTPAQTEQSLVASVPRRLWDELNCLLVGFGQQVCSAIKPKCAECRAREFCPFGQRAVRSAAASRGGRRKTK
eukprot:GHVU01233362.1.p1 GENE.GHVU01233362.1~~GHVU01233362.1.p1  ORF type:complete len:526 (-),score=57.51 GHVU01233362.1:374-1951(-)